MITTKQKSYLEQITRLHGPGKVQQIATRLNLAKPFADLTRAEAHGLIDALAAAGLDAKIDTAQICKQADLLALIRRETELKKVANTRGGEWAGPCPACGGDDRFHVQPAADPPAWFCSNCTNRNWKDVIAYGQIIHGLDFLGACELATGGNIPLANGSRATVAGSSPGPVKPPPPRERTQPKAYTLKPPPAAWQDRGRAFVDYAEAQLWETPQALEYLHGRGLTDETIKAARLGWNPKAVNDTPARWGVTDTPAVWLPAGLVMPWFVGGDLWRIEIRQPNGKKIGPTGYRQGLYNADALATDKPAVLVEGVIDALTIKQAAGDIVTPVATGATSHARKALWIARLALAPLVLVAFDNEPTKGDKAAQYWTEALPNARRWRPFWDDVNKMAQDGADVRGWIVAGLPQEAKKPLKVITWPADLPLATYEGQSRRLGDGQIEAWYYNAHELAYCLELTQTARALGGQ